MSTIYYTDITALPEDISPLLTRLSDRRRRQLWALVGEKSRRRCLASGLLLKEVLGSDDVALSEFGKPTLPGGSPFSLAHSGDYVVLAVSSGPVGVDIEKHRPLRFFELTARFFAAERACADSLSAFFDLWTAKEALAKMLGVGLALSMRRYVLEKRDGNYISLAFPDAVFTSLSLLPDYSMTLCCEEPYDGRLIRINLN